MIQGYLPFINSCTRTPTNAYVPFLTSFFWWCCLITTILYADNQALIAKSEDELQKATNILNKTENMKISEKKIRQEMYV